MRCDVAQRLGVTPPRIQQRSGPTSIRLGSRRRQIGVAANVGGLGLLRAGRRSWIVEESKRESIICPYLHPSAGEVSNCRFSVNANAEMNTFRVVAPRVASTWTSAHAPAALHWVSLARLDGPRRLHTVCMLTRRVVSRLVRQHYFLCFYFRPQKFRTP